MSLVTSIHNLIIFLQLNLSCCFFRVLVSRIIDCQQNWNDLFNRNVENMLLLRCVCFCVCGFFFCSSSVFEFRLKLTFGGCWLSSLHYVFFHTVFPYDDVFNEIDS